MRFEVASIRRREVLAWAGLSGAGLAACTGVAGPGTRALAQDYAASLRSALEPFTDRLPGYHYRSTPLGNFGVGSIYLGDVRGSDLARAESGWFLGDSRSWLAPGLPEPQRREWRSRVISEGSLGALQIDANRSRSIEQRLGVSIFIALGADASLEFERGAEVSFRASAIRNRRLNWSEFRRAMAVGQIANEVADAVRQDDFIIAAADLVLLDYRAEVTVDETVNPSLDAALREKAHLPVAKGGVFGGALALRETSRGRFVVASSQPVVAAVLFKRPPRRAKGGPPPADLNSWPAVDPSTTSLDAVNARVLQSGR